MIDSSLRGINSYSLQNYLEDYIGKDLNHFFEPWVFSKGFSDFEFATQCQLIRYVFILQNTQGLRMKELIAIMKVFQNL